METYKINSENLKLSISNIFNIKINNINYIENKSFFNMDFVYKNIIVHIYTNMDREHNCYQEIEIKRVSDQFEFQWTPYSMILAYYDNEKFNSSIDYNYLLLCISNLKGYIDAGKVFFEFYKKDYSERFFVLEDVIKKMPLVINLKEETKLRFGDAAYKIENNKEQY